MKRIARCCCRNLSIEVTAEPEIFGICHCDNCKARTGSAFGISSYFSIDDVVEIVGASKVYRLHNSKQGHDQERHFCTGCGTTLYWYVSDMPNMIGIAGGCFIENDLGVPVFSANNKTICSWLFLNSDIKDIA